MPFPLAWALGHFLETLCTPLGLHPHVTRLAVAIMGRDNHVNTSKALREIGWRTRVSYADAMRHIGKYVKHVFSV